MKYTCFNVYTITNIFQFLAMFTHMLAILLQYILKRRNTAYLWFNSITQK